MLLVGSQISYDLLSGGGLPIQVNTPFLFSIVHKDSILQRSFSFQGRSSLRDLDSKVYIWMHDTKRIGFKRISLLAS